MSLEFASDPPGALQVHGVEPAPRLDAVVEIPAADQRESTIPFESLSRHDGDALPIDDDGPSGREAEIGQLRRNNEDVGALGFGAAPIVQRSIGAGWVANWWWDLRHNPNLSSLHQRADYESLVAGLESKMARQLSELEAAGVASTR